eukprot:PhF_6_TR37136/c0_g1_i2/m.54640
MGKVKNCRSPSRVLVSENPWGLTKQDLGGDPTTLTDSRPILALIAQEFQRRSEIMKQETATRVLWDMYPEELEEYVTNVRHVVSSERNQRDSMLTTENAFRSTISDHETLQREILMKNMMKVMHQSSLLSQLIESEASMREHIRDSEDQMFSFLWSAKLQTVLQLVTAPPRALLGTLGESTALTIVNDNAQLTTFTPPTLHVRSHVHLHDLTAFQQAWHKSGDTVITFSRGNLYDVDLTGDNLRAHGWNGVVASCVSDVDGTLVAAFVCGADGTSMELHIIAMDDVELGVTHEEY